MRGLTRDVETVEVIVSLEPENASDTIHLPDLCPHCEMAAMVVIARLPKEKGAAFPPWKISMNSS